MGVLLLLGAEPLWCGGGEGYAIDAHGLTSTTVNGADAVFITSRPRSGLGSVLSSSPHSISAGTILIIIIIMVDVILVIVVIVGGTADGLARSSRSPCWPNDPTTFRGCVQRTLITAPTGGPFPSTVDTALTSTRPFRKGGRAWIDTHRGAVRSQQRGQQTRVVLGLVENASELMVRHVADVYCSISCIIVYVRWAANSRTGRSHRRCKPSTRGVGDVHQGGFISTRHGSRGGIRGGLRGPLEELHVLRGGGLARDLLQLLHPELHLALHRRGGRCGRHGVVLCRRGGRGRGRGGGRGRVEGGVFIVVVFDVVIAPSAVSAVG